MKMYKGLISRMSQRIVALSWLTEAMMKGFNGDHEISTISLLWTLYFQKGLSIRVYTSWVVLGSNTSYILKIESLPPVAINWLVGENLTTHIGSVETYTSWANLNVLSSDLNSLTFFHLLGWTFTTPWRPSIWAIFNLNPLFPWKLLDFISSSTLVILSEGFFKLSEKACVEPEAFVKGAVVSICVLNLPLSATRMSSSLSNYG